MSDQQDERTGRAVTDGLVALVAVSLAVGLTLALVAFVGLRMLGFGDDGSGSDASEQERMSIPPMEETTGPSGPAITLATPESESEETTSESASEQTKKPKKKAEDKDRISLSAGQVEVDNFDRIDLTGTYPGGEGAVLQVQRFENGSWQDFPTTAAVSNETFSTYVQTGVGGVNRFRMLDKNSGVESNEVKVRVSG